MLLFELGCQFRHRDVFIRLDPADQIRRVDRQLAAARRSSYAGWFDRAGQFLALGNPNSGAGADAKAPSGCPARLACVNLSRNSFPKIC